MDNSVIKNDREIFQKEQDELLYAILDARFFQPWKRKTYPQRDTVPKGSLELFITPTCNQNCEYCYLQKYSGLYPSEYNNKETITKNLRHLLDWCIEEDFFLPNLDLFSGEIWHTSFGLEILDIVYEYVTQKGLICSTITIPTNGTFIHDKKQTIEIQNRIDAFKEIGCKVVISISIDGKYIEDMERPRYAESQIRDDKFYDDLFTFAKHNEYGFHPMLSAQSAKHWKKNFQWWLMMLKKYDMPMERLMLLEVRNDDWTDECIAEYKEFLRYLLDLTLKYHDNKIETVVNDLFLYNQVYETEEGKDNLLWGESMPYIPITLSETKGFYGCTVSTHMTVRLGDLAICPCHRTAYNKYLYGYFKQDENGKIIGVKANNPQIAINILMLDNRKVVLGCDSCIFKDVCLGTCKGQSIESHNDPFYNDPKVCNFLYQKYSTIYDLYEEKGIMDWLEKNLTKYHTSYPIWAKFLDTWKKLKKERKDAELAEFRQNFYRDCCRNGD